MDTLPDEILLHIFTNFNLLKYPLVEVCKKWNKLLQDYKPETINIFNTLKSIGKSYEYATFLYDRGFYCPYKYSRELASQLANYDNLLCYIFIRRKDCALNTPYDKIYFDYCAVKIITYNYKHNLVNDQQYIFLAAIYTADIDKVNKLETHRGCKLPKQLYGAIYHCPDERLKVRLISKYQPDMMFCLQLVHIYKNDIIKFMVENNLKINVYICYHAIDADNLDILIFALKNGVKYNEKIYEKAILMDRSSICDWIKRNKVN